MDRKILEKLYENEGYLNYLRYHPNWYQYLDDDPKNYSLFESEVKKALKLTTRDKLEKLQNQINFANALMKYMNKN